MSEDNDYFSRLTALSGKLLDVAIEESDPDNWQSAGKPIKSLSTEERGNRYWDKKNAAGSLTLLIKVQSLIGMHSKAKPLTKLGAEQPDDDFDNRIKRAEKEAEKILDRVLSKPR
ncbi:hypothetical protein JKC89_003746 [Salmonella enterica]|nr:hypothetical protein [Salmonella enterica]EHA8579414.1 hypothetical protein [Salmonella enterica]